MIRDLGLVARQAYLTETANSRRASDGLVPGQEAYLLLIRTRIAASPIHGVGCFACEAVTSGTMVWRLDPRFDLMFARAEILSMPRAIQTLMVQYASKDAGVDRYVYCSDNARFINHASFPNLVHNSVSSATEMFSQKDIAPGEELTLDYGFVDDPFEAGNVLTEIGRSFGDAEYLDHRLKT